jgi:CubicO group peptidase (beta-lactamase class C family)
MPHAVSESAPQHHLPDGNDFLMWSPAEQVFGYRIIDRLFATRRIAAKAPRPMTRGPALDLSDSHDGTFLDVNAFMSMNNVAGLLVLHRGAILHECYGLGLQPSDRWTTMSTVKSMTSTLVGAAVHDGSIATIDEPIIRYLPGLKGSAYDRVTVRNLLTMSSGVSWNEDYGDRESDVNQYSRLLAQRVPGGVLALLTQLEAAAEPGTRWHYNTGDTYLLGAVLAAATGVSIAEYMSRKIWTPCGMEFDAFYTLESEGGLEIGGSRASMTLRDMGRFAQFVLDRGQAGNASILPADWVEQAANSAFELPADAMVQRAGLRVKSYGFNWWLDGEGGMFALGHSGQRIYVHLREQFALVQLAAYPEPRYAVNLGFDMDTNLRHLIDATRLACNLR